MKINMNNLWLHLIIYMVIHVGIQDLVDANSKKYMASRTTLHRSDDGIKYDDGIPSLNDVTMPYGEDGKDINEYGQPEDGFQGWDGIIGEFRSTYTPEHDLKSNSYPYNIKGTVKSMSKTTTSKTKEETKDYSDDSKYDYSYGDISEEEHQNKLGKKGESERKTAKKKKPSMSLSYDDDYSKEDFSDFYYDKGPGVSSDKYDGKNGQGNDGVFTKRKDNNNNGTRITKAIPEGLDRSDGKGINEYGQPEDGFQGWDGIIGELRSTYTPEHDIKSNSYLYNKRRTAKNMSKTTTSKGEIKDYFPESDYDYSYDDTSEEEHQNKIGMKGESERKTTKKKKSSTSFPYEDDYSKEDLSDSYYDKGPGVSSDKDDNEYEEDNDEVPTKTKDDNDGSKITKAIPGGLEGQDKKENGQPEDGFQGWDGINGKFRSTYTPQHDINSNSYLHNKRGTAMFKMVTFKTKEETQDYSDESDNDYSYFDTFAEEHQNKLGKQEESERKTTKKETSTKSDPYEDDYSKENISDSYSDKDPGLSSDDDYGKYEEGSEDVSTKRKNDNDGAKKTKAILGSLGHYFVYVNCTECRIRSELLVKGRKFPVLKNGTPNADGSNDNDSDEGHEDDADENDVNEQYSDKKEEYSPDEGIRK